MRHRAQWTRAVHRARLVRIGQAGTRETHGMIHDDREDELTLREMADRFRIQDLLYREARAIDERDWELWRSCYTEDADIDWRENGAIRDRRDAAGAWLASVCENFPLPAYQHFVTNIEMRIDGDSAQTRQLQLIPISLASPGGGRQIAFSGIWFEDTLRREGRAWKIATRLEKLAWRHNFPDQYQTPDVAPNN
jgi:hypothetical protein